MAFFRGPSFNLSDRGNAQRVTGAQVTRDMLDVLGLKPLIGRNFSVDEDKPGGAKVVLLNYGLWQRMFQGDRNVLGRVLKLDEEAYTVIGVLPRDFRFMSFKPDMMFPLRLDRSKAIVGNFSYQGLARLKDGVSVDALGQVSGLDYSNGRAITLTLYETAR